MQTLTRSRLTTCTFTRSLAVSRARTQLPCQATILLLSRNLSTSLPKPQPVGGDTDSPPTLRRSYLYVPSSSSKMLEKTKTSDSDVFVYDLEDSISPVPSDKVNARERLRAFLSTDPIANHERVGVRVNDISTPYFEEDIQTILALENVRTLILPKIHSAQDLDYVSRCIYDVYMKSDRESDLNVIPSIESARAMMNLQSIASWGSKLGKQMGGELSALLFAAEDYCADTGILRGPTRRELLYTRSQIVIAAKAFGLEAIDMVCVQYKDPKVLQDECLDGRQLGFTGKQAIHPAQVTTIQSTYVPTDKEILRAAKILHSMKQAHDVERGAVGLEGEMIDAPMLKQAEKTIAIAEAAGLTIPDVSST